PTGGAQVTPNVMGAVDITARGEATCARLMNGSVQCWGANEGRLGVGNSYSQTTPATIMGFTGVEQLAMGVEASCARKTDGTVWCWGYNNVGQVGDNTYSDRGSPVQLASLSGVTDIASGRSHSCAV